MINGLIDERALEELLAEVAEQIPVPPDGVQRVVDRAVTTTRPAPHRARSRTRMLLAAAAVVAVLAGGASVLVVDKGDETNVRSAALKVRDGAAM